MTMEIYVLSDAELKSISAWQDAIAREGFPLRLEGDGELSEVSGWLPAILEQKQTGFECRPREPREFFDACHNVQFDREWKYVLALLWGGDFAEMQAAMMAATAYARATDGIVFEPQGGQALSASEAFDAVQENKRIMSELNLEA